MTVFRLQLPGRPALTLGPDDQVLTIGRTAENRIHIDDRTLSRVHARLTLQGGVATLQDLGSTNGTAVNGAVLTAPREVRPGDTLTFGGVSVVLAAEARPEVLIGAHESGALPAVAYRGSATQLWQAGKAPGADRGHQALSLIHTMSLALIRETAPDALLEDLLAQLFTYLEADRGVVLMRQGQEEPAPLAVRNREGRAARGAIRLSHTLIEAVLDRGEAILLRNPADPDLGSRSIVMSGITTAIVTPLEAEGQIIGILYFDAFAPRRPFDEDELRVAATLAHLAASRLHQARLVAEVQQKRALERDMAIAATIQQRMLPPGLTGDHPLRLFAELRPALEVGGDLYDFFVKDGHLRFCIGDVAGKGIPAALVMALARTLFRALGELMEDPAEVMAAVNRRLCEDTESDRFVTAFCGSLDLATGRLRYCNGGHDRPLRLLAGRPLEEVEATPGLALGVLPGYRYRSQEATLAPGETLVLFTDGVTESLDPEGNLFTLPRLREALADRDALEPEALVRSLQEACAQFAAGAPQADDLTLVVIRFLGAQP